MAIRIWISTDGNMAATGSWSGAAVPATGDIVIFDPAYSKVAPISGLDLTVGGTVNVNLTELLALSGVIQNGRPPGIMESWTG